MATRGVRYRADYIWEAPDDGLRYEVIDGKLFVSPAPSWPHQRGLGRLFTMVSVHVYGLGLGEVVTAPIGLVLDDENGVQPDMVYISRGRLGIISQRGIEGAPDLVVEVLSPSTQSRDRGRKMRRYAASGIPNYWMLVPEIHGLEAYRLGPQGYELTGRYGPGDMFRPELFPGLEIPISDLWE